MSNPSNAPLGALLAALASTAACILAAFLTTTIADAGGIASASDLYWIPAAAVFVLIVALLHAFLVGLPIHAFLPARWRASLLVNLLGGFLTGGVPLPLLVLILSGGSDADAGSNFVFYQGLLSAAAALGGLGLVGGLVFWLVARDDAYADMADDSAAVP